MPWILFFFLGGAAVLASSPAKSSGSKKPGKYGLTFSEDQRDAILKSVKGIPLTSAVLPNAMLAPYRLQDARKLGEWIADWAFLKSQGKLESAVWSDLGHPEIPARLRDVATHAERLGMMTWKDEAQAVAAWVDLVIAPSFQFYLWATWLPHDVKGFASEACGCTDQNGVYQIPANLEGSKALGPNCLCFREGETLSALALWLTGYYTSPRQALVASDGSSLTWAWGSVFPNAPSSWLLAGKSSKEKLYATSTPRPADDHECQRLMLELDARVMALYPVFALLDKGNVPRDSIALEQIPNALQSLYAQNKIENTVTVAGWTQELLVRSQYLANAAVSQQVRATDPTRWVSKGFGLFVEVWVAAASLLGLGPLAQTFTNAAMGLVGSASSLVGVSLPASATTLISFAVKAAINGAIIQGLLLSPLGGVLPGLSTDQMLDQAKKTAEKALGDLKTKGQAEIASQLKGSANLGAVLKGLA